MMRDALCLIRTKQMISNRNDASTMKRHEIRRLFKKKANRGSFHGCARYCGVSQAAISQWLAGNMTSASVEQGIRDYASQLLAKERGQLAA